MNEPLMFLDVNDRLNVPIAEIGTVPESVFPCSQLIWETHCSPTRGFIADCPGSKELLLSWTRCCVLIGR